MGGDKLGRLDRGDMVSATLVALAAVGALAWPRMSIPAFACSATWAAISLSLRRRASAHEAKTRKPNGATWYLGAGHDARGQVWLTDTDMLAHSAVRGCQEDIVNGLTIQALSRGCGVVRIASEGRHGWKCLALVAESGRGDDLICLDLLRTGRTAQSRHHGWNPFAAGSAFDLARILDAAFEPGDSKDRLSILQAVLDVMVHERETIGARITVEGVVANLERPALLALRDRAVATMPGEVHARLRNHVAMHEPSEGGSGWDRDDARRAGMRPQLASVQQAMTGDPTSDPADVDLDEALANRRALMVYAPNKDIQSMLLAGIEIALERLQQVSAPCVRTLLVFGAGKDQVSHIQRLAPLCRSRGVAMLVLQAYRDDLPNDLFASSGANSLRGRKKAVHRGINDDPRSQEPDTEDDEIIIDGQPSSCTFDTDAGRANDIPDRPLDILVRAGRDPRRERTDRP